MGEAAAEVIHTFMPGEEIKMQFELQTKALIVGMSAVFVKDKGSPNQRQLRLSKARQARIRSQRVGDYRRTRIELTQEQQGDTVRLGDYWLDSIEAVTQRGKRLRLENITTPRVCIRKEQEPEEDTPVITDVTFPSDGYS